MPTTTRRAWTPTPGRAKRSARWVPRATQAQGPRQPRLVSCVSLHRAHHQLPPPSSRGRLDVPCRMRQPGYYCSGGQRYSCGSNSRYCPGATSTYTSVQTGFYSTGGDSLTRSGESECEAGHYCVAGVKSPCEAGSFTNDVRTTQCTLCSPGYRSDEGATGCNECDAGYYCLEGHGDPQYECGGPDVYVRVWRGTGGGGGVRLGRRPHHCAPVVLHDSAAATGTARHSLGFQRW